MTLLCLILLLASYLEVTGTAFSDMDILGATRVQDDGYPLMEYETVL